MNVPNIGQGLGSMTALPRAAGESDTASTRSGSVASGRSLSRSAGTGVDFARLAWFDVNGDGELDPRSAAAGGDATLLVPAYAVDFPTYARAASQSPTARPLKGTPANVAQTNRAVGAYQRYGEAHAASAAPAAATPPAAPAAPTPPADPAPAVQLAAPLAPVTTPVVTPERAVA